MKIAIYSRKSKFTGIGKHPGIIKGSDWVRVQIWW